MKRVIFSAPESLIREFDKKIKGKFLSRSDALRSLIRRYLEGEEEKYE